MAGNDENTYGFRKDDADALIASIGMGESETPGRRLGGGSGARLFRFTLNADFTTGTADADILLMDGTDTGIDANVLDPLGIFDSLVSGDAGLCLRQFGSYYAIQAACPE